MGVPHPFVFLQGGTGAFMVGSFLTKRSIRIGVLVALSGITLAFIFSIRSIFVPFGIALAISYALDPFLRFAEDRGLSRVWAILLAYAILGLLVALFLLGVVPTVVVELNKLADAIPSFTRQVQDLIRVVQSNYSRFVLPESLRSVIDDTINRFQQITLDLIGAVVNRTVGVFSGLFNLILAPILAFYLLRDLELIKRGIVNVLPSTHRRELVALGADIDAVLGGFVRGQLLVAVIVGVLVGVILSLLGMRFAALIGIIAGITNIIPYFGPVIGAIPAIALALLTGPVLALKVLIALVAVQQLEGSIISPQIVGDRVGLHPLTIIFALLAGAKLFGFLGLLLAVPVAGVIKVTLKHLFDYLSEEA